MYKIKTLLVCTVVLALLYAVHFLSSAFGHNVFQYYETNTIPEKVLFVLVLLMELIIFVGLVFISIGLIQIIKSGIFTFKPANCIKTGGILFLLVSVLDFIYVFHSVIEFGNPELWLQRIFTNVLLVLLGLTALIVSDVLSQGSFIKQENDLTI